MTTHDRSRVQKGVPTGGQFATESRSEVDIDLPETTPSVERISLAEARRHLPEGQVVQVVYPGRDFAEPVLRTIEKQTDHQMVSLDDEGKDVYLQWAHQSAERTSDGMVVVSNDAGVPYVGFMPIDSGSYGSGDLSLDDHPVVEAILEAKQSDDPNRIAELAGSDSEAVQMAAIANEVADAHALDMAMRSGSDAVRLAVAEHPKVSEDTLHNLRTSGAEEVRDTVARRTSRPDTLADLSTDESDHVRQSVALNSSTAPTTLAAMAQRERLGSYPMQGIGRNQNTPPDVLRTLARSDGHTMAGVAKNPSTPTGVLAEMSHDTSTGNQVQAMVASNPSTDPETLGRLVKQGDDWVHQHAATNPKLTVDQAAGLASSNNPRVRRRLARSTPLSSVQASLANDKEASVRADVASNPATSVDLLVRLSDDSWHATRAAVARNPSTPPEILERFRYDERNVAMAAEANLKSRA